MCMKAIQMSGFGGSEVLRVGSVPRPRPGNSQVLVKVQATSVNRPDLVQREGRYPPPPGESEILGLEIAGTIQELGPGVADWKIGDRVFGLVGGGGYAEYALAHASHLMPIPETMSAEEAACICESYITAYLNIFLLGGFQAGQTALLHGGGGGVNTAAIQLCRALAPGCRLIVTASTEKRDRVRSAGADEVIDFRKTSDFSPIVLSFTDGRGVDLILDHVGAAYFKPNLAALAIEGCLVCIGVTSGISAELNIALLMMKRQRIIGSVLRSRSAEDKGRIIAAFTESVLPKLADRTIVPLIEAVLPLEKAAEAHRMMEEDRHFGKIVLQIAEG